MKFMLIRLSLKVVAASKRAKSAGRGCRSEENKAELGLPLGLEALVMTPNGVMFLFFSSNEAEAGEE